MYSRSVGVTALPIVLARRYSGDEEETEEHREFWKHILGLFEEAIIQIDARNRIQKKTS